MKISNGQSSKESSFLLNSDQKRPLYSQQDSADSALDQPLFKYLFMTGQISKPSEDHFEKSEGGTQLRCCQLQEGNTIKQKIKKGKRFSIQERVKTDFCQAQLYKQDEVRHLRRVNESLKQRLLVSEKAVAGLQCLQAEVQYLKKLSFLQESEIDKLRRMLKQAQCQKLELMHAGLKNQPLGREDAAKQSPKKMGANAKGQSSSSKKKGKRVEKVLSESKQNIFRDELVCQLGGKQEEQERMGRSVRKQSMLGKGGGRTVPKKYFI